MIDIWVGRGGGLTENAFGGHTNGPCWVTRSNESLLEWSMLMAVTIIHVAKCNLESILIHLFENCLYPCVYEFQMAVIG
jgi:hypothetical protein